MKEHEMKLTFTLPDGTRAGLQPAGELKDFTLDQLGIKCLTPARHASVVFHVADRAALERVRTRFGFGRC
jgi:hypothetical protein